MKVLEGPEHCLGSAPVPPLSHMVVGLPNTLNARLTDRRGNSAPTYTGNPKLWSVSHFSPFSRLYLFILAVYINFYTHLNVFSHYIVRMADIVPNAGIYDLYLPTLFTFFIPRRVEI